MTKRPTARIFRSNAKNLRWLAARLQAGELVAVPTETVYGLAANAFDAGAVRKIFRAKGRPTTDPLIVHIHALAQLETICEPNAAALALAKRFWPGPLTLVLPKKPSIPDIVTAGKSSIAVRMPAHRDFRRLLALARMPLAAPSANPFGYISPTTAEHVREGLGSRIRYILDGGPATVGLESTIVDLRNPAKPRLLRPGAITAAQLERVLQQKISAPSRRPSKSNASHAQLAPGMLARHYSPRTPLVLHEKIRPPFAAESAYVFAKKPRGAAGPNVLWLESRGNLRGTARRLFALLRQLDAMGFETIQIERARGGGLADAINDRLERAAAR